MPCMLTFIFGFISFRRKQNKIRNEKALLLLRVTCAVLFHFFLFTIFYYYFILDFVYENIKYTERERKCERKYVMQTYKKKININKEYVFICLLLLLMVLLTIMLWCCCV